MKKVSDTEGYLLLYKNPGETSFDALRLVKKILGTDRVGHTGTLDKFAEGLLLVFIGRATKLVQWFTGCDKVYEGCVRFGLETDTLDPEGTPVAYESAPEKDLLEKIIPSFIGPQIQIPPAYSSIHIDGKRAHELVRSGTIPEMKGRQIHIYDIQLLSFDGTDAHIKVHCSKGTYIRSLARDIGRAAGSRAYLHTLKRVKLGNFSIEDAYNPVLHKDDTVFLPLKPLSIDTFKHMNIALLQADRSTLKKIMYGQAIDIHCLDALCSLDQRDVSLDTADSAALFDEQGNFAAMMQKKNDFWSYAFVYAHN